MLIRAATTAIAAGIATALFLAAPATALPERGVGPASPAGSAGSATVRTPRTLVKKPNSKDMFLPVSMDGTRMWTGRLAVKFRDELGMRADAVPSDGLRARRQPAADQAASVLKKYSATVRPMLRAPASKLAAIEQRAASLSGFEQPDLQSMMFVDLPPESLLEAAREFNDLDIVEWVHIEERPVTCDQSSSVLGENQSPQFGCGTDGPGVTAGIVNCNQPAPAYLQLGNEFEQLGSIPGRCTLEGECNNAGACAATPVGLSCVFGCNNKTCCGLVSDILPYCVDEEVDRGWDASCATYANLLCGGPQGTVYSLAQGTPSTGIPRSYSFDPCFAMRAPITPPGYRGPYDDATRLTVSNFVMVYGFPQVVGEVPPLLQPEFPEPYPAGCVEPNDPARPTNCFDGQATSCSACPPCCCGVGGDRRPCCGTAEETGTPLCAFQSPDSFPVPPGEADPRIRVVPSQLLTYVTSSNGTCVLTQVPTADEQVPGTATAGLVRVVYPTGSPSDEGDSGTGVAQQARPDPSLEGIGVALSGPCQSAAAGRVGCNETPCCVLVCRQDPSCCEVEWDQGCVELAVAGSIDPDGEGPIQPACSGTVLPVDVFPPTGTTPVLTGGIITTSSPSTSTTARGFQLQTIGRPVLTSGQTLPVNVPNPVSTLPTVNDPIDPPPPPPGGFANPKSNLGTLSFLASGYRGGGLDLQLWDTRINQLNLQLPPTSSPITEAERFGEGVTVAVLDYSAFVNHEDLVGRVTPEPNQTIILLQSPPLDPQHGTAVLGTIGAARNGFGVTGIAWGAALNFYPIASLEEGYRLPNALANAIVDLDQGDIILMPISFGQVTGSPSLGRTILVDPAVFLLSNLAAQSGIAVIVPAGNDALPVVTSPDGSTDSGALVVGACWPGQQFGYNPQDNSPAPNPFPGNNYCRIPSSNFSSLQTGTNTVHCSGWGIGVTTTGLINTGLFRGTNGTNPLDPEFNQLRNYSNTFGGTSAASAMIAGWAACIQAFAEAYSDSPLGTFPPGPGLESQLRSQISRPSNIHQQCGEPYTPSFPGFPQGGSAASGDRLRTGQSVARIGGFPNCGPTLSSVVATITGGNSGAGAGNGSARIYTVITGTVESGSGNSLVTTDGRFMRIAAIRRRSGSQGLGAGTPLLYPITGGTTDLQIERTVQDPPQDLTVVGMQVTSRSSVPVPVYELVYFYNFSLQRWQSAGSQFLSAIATQGIVATAAGDVSSFATGNAAGGSTLYGRVYTASLSPGVYSALHDRVDLDVAENILIPDIPPK